MPFVTIPAENYRLYYEEQGRGLPVILLHNATGSTRDWRYLMPRLVEAGYRAIAYDRRGFGRSDDLPEPDWPLDYLHTSRDELLALLDALDIESAALVGNSDGATIALLAAAKAPERVALVVAEAPHMWYDRKSLKQGFRHFRDTLEYDNRFIKAMRKAHGVRADEVIRRWKQRWLDPAFFSWNDLDAVTHVKCPVLIIHGEKDVFFPISHSQQISEYLDQVELDIWPDVGHTPHLERPEEYARRIIEFLDGNRPDD